MPLDGSESVLTVAAANLTVDGYHPGYTPLPARRHALPSLMLGARYRPRTAELERDEAWRQVVVYVVAVHDGKAFVFRRTRAGAEERLHGKASVGVGGHVNSFDGMELPAAWGLTVGNAARRELCEEFGVLPDRPLRPCGVLVDDSDAVGRVHVGLVVAWAVPSPGRLRFAPEVDPVGWQAPAQLRESSGEGFENWTRILIPHLPAIVEAADASPAMADFGPPRGGRPGPRAVADAFAGSVPAGTEPYARAGSGAARAAAAALARLDGDRGRRRGR